MSTTRGNKPYRLYQIVDDGTGTGTKRKYVSAYDTPAKLCEGFERKHTKEPTANWSVIHITGVGTAVQSEEFKLTVAEMFKVKATGVIKQKPLKVVSDNTKIKEEAKAPPEKVKKAAKAKSESKQKTTAKEGPNRTRTKEVILAEKKEEEKLLKEAAPIAAEMKKPDTAIAEALTKAQKAAVAKKAKADKKLAKKTENRSDAPRTKAVGKESPKLPEASPLTETVSTLPTVDLSSGTETPEPQTRKEYDQLFRAKNNHDLRSKTPEQLKAKAFSKAASLERMGQWQALYDSLLPYKEELKVLKNTVWSRFRSAERHLQAVAEKEAVAA